MRPKPFPAETGRIDPVGDGGAVIGLTLKVTHADAQRSPAMRTREARLMPETIEFRSHPAVATWPQKARQWCPAGDRRHQGLISRGPGRSLRARGCPPRARRRLTLAQRRLASWR